MENDRWAALMHEPSHHRPAPPRPAPPPPLQSINDRMEDLAIRSVSE